MSTTFSNGASYDLDLTNTILIVVRDFVIGSIITIVLDLLGDEFLTRVVSFVLAIVWLLFFGRWVIVPEGMFRLARRKRKGGTFLPYGK